MAGEWYAGVAAAYVDNKPEVAHSMTQVAGPGWFTVANRASINAAPVDDLTSDSYGAAVYVGYQGVIAGMLTGGIEADSTFFDGDGADSVSTAYPNPPGTYNLKQEFSQTWIGSLRLRVGLDLGMANVFVTGGAALTDVDYSGSFSDNYPVPQQIPLQVGKTSQTASGYTYGGGIDIGISSSMKLRAEYLHFDFGDVGDYSRTLVYNTGAATTGPEVLRGNAKLENDTVRLGLSFKL